MKTYKSKDKDKTDLIQRVSKLSLSKKEDKLIQKILVKGLKNWNDNDIEFLTLLYDLHYYPILSIGGIDISNRPDEIRREAEVKRENAIKRLIEEPYSLWFKDVRNYK
jgi:hypothetical protein